MQLFQISFKLEIGMIDDVSGEWSTEKIQGIAFGEDVYDAIRNVYNQYVSSQTAVIDFSFRPFGTTHPVVEVDEMSVSWFDKEGE